MVNGQWFTIRCPDGDSAPLIKIRTHISNSRLRVVSDSRRTRQMRKTRDSRGRHATDGEDTRQEPRRDKRLPTFHFNCNSKKAKSNVDTRGLFLESLENFSATKCQLSKSNLLVLKS